MRVILFDGVCHFCDASVQFILKRDKGAFHFASLQSDIGRKLVQQYEIQTDSVVLIEYNQAYTHSTAALKIARELGFPWRLLYMTKIIPVGIRDWVYHVVAKNRYKWFGQKEVCAIPSTEDRARFLS